MTARLRLSQCGLGAGKKARLRRILYQHDESLRLVDRLREILAKYPTP